MTFIMTLTIIYIAYILFLSFISFLLFRKDKKLAIKGQERIKEKTLLSICTYGGALGGEIGRRVFRHKTDKSYFSIVIYFSILLQIIPIIIMVVGW